MSKSWVPHPYQRRGIEFLLGAGAGMLAWDMGLGKSSVTLSTFKLLREKGLVTKALVVAPLRAAHQVWPAEAAKWAHLKDLKVVVMHGPRKDAMLAGEWDVAVVNPEGLGWLFKALGKTFPFEMLVLDESTLFKNSRTLRFKTLKPHLGKFRRRYALTGTPAPNGLLDLFGQVYCLDGGHALGPYITHYRNEFFDSTGFGGYTFVLKAGAEEVIYERLRPLVLRMSSKDYLDLPKLVENDVMVTLPPAARAAYQQMEDDLLVDLEAGAVVAANAAAAAGKCRQMASGAVYTTPEEGEKPPQTLGSERPFHPLHEAKLDAVEEIVESAQGSPVLVAYEYDHERVRLQERFPKAPHIGGGVSTARFKEIEAQWNMGLIPVLLAQPQSVAHGLNLQAGGNTVVWYTLTWARDLYDQFNARVHRQGQTKPCIVHRILSTGTVDVAVRAALKAKGRTQTALLEALKEYGRQA